MKPLSARYADRKFLFAYSLGFHLKGKNTQIVLCAFRQRLITGGITIPRVRMEQLIFSLHCAMYYEL